MADHPYIISPAKPSPRPGIQQHTITEYVQKHLPDDLEEIVAGDYDTDDKEDSETDSEIGDKERVKENIQGDRQFTQEDISSRLTTDLVKATMQEMHRLAQACALCIEAAIYSQNPKFHLSYDRPGVSISPDFLPHLAMQYNEARLAYNTILNAAVDPKDRDSHEEYYELLLPMLRPEVSKFLRDLEAKADPQVKDTLYGRVKKVDFVQAQLALRRRLDKLMNDLEARWDKGKTDPGQVKLAVNRGLRGLFWIARVIAVGTVTVVQIMVLLFIMLFGLLTIQIIVDGLCHGFQGSYMESLRHKIDDWNILNHVEERKLYY